jgi:hypothetical protein
MREDANQTMVQRISGEPSNSPEFTQFASK